MKPTVLRDRTGIQLNYDLPHNIRGTHVYPRQSSNGSTVVVYGSDTGLRVVWYAGKKFRSSTSTPKVNGHSKNDAMVIDLDSDDGQTEAPEKAEFEDEYDEIDPSNAYYGILRHLDIPLGSAALKLAVPNLPQDGVDGSSSLLESSLVVAAACADYTIRVILLPLDPPAPSITDASEAGLQLTTLPLLNYHQSLISSVAVTISSESTDEVPEAQTDQVEHHASRCLLVASTSATGSGLLLVHQVASEGRKLGDAILLRRTILRAPMMAARICFNTASPSAARHSELLVTIPDAPCVKVYQVFPVRVRQRRGSTATNASGSTSRATGSSVSAGKFLVTLLPDFKAASKDGEVKRKRVLDAQWISGGRAVLALLEDGEWGIWDLEAAGPVGNSNMIQGQNNVTGIVGGGITKFAVGGSGIGKPKTTEASGHATSAGAARGQHSSTGMISVFQSESRRNDESAILSCDGEAQFIPSIGTYWRSRMTGKGAMQPTDRATILPKLRTGGESVKAIAVLPSYPNEAQQGSSELQTLPNFLVSTSTRLIFHVNPLREPDDGRSTQADDVDLKRSVLESGDLDLDEVDRYLDGMSRPTTLGSPTPTRRRLFA